MQLKNGAREKIQAYVREYGRLLDIERDAEKAAALEEIRRLSGRERERFGRALLDLEGRGAGRLFDLWLVRFGRSRPIRTEMAGGDVVLVSRGDPLKSDLQATVVRVGRQYVEAAFTQAPPKWVRRRGVRLDLFVNDVTFKRMAANLEAMAALEGPPARLRDIVLGLRAPEPPEPAAFEPLHPGLDRSQKEAVSLALGSRDIFLIHGPPGTGKTTTVAETAVQFVRRGSRVLACADSNVAVDNLLARLKDVEGLDVVRIGHPVRIDPALEAHSLAARLEAHPVRMELERVRKLLEPLLEERDRHLKPTPGTLRGMSPERVRTLAAQGRGMRGIGAEQMASMAAWIDADREAGRFYDRLRELEEEATAQIIDGADVVCATNATVGGEAMQGRRFDVALIDEAGQQIEPSTLLPLLRADRAVLAGDHRQLPPTVVSGLDVLERSLFERLMERGDAAAKLLNVQYRMNATVMDFPNRLMYGGRLVADAGVAGRRLALTRPPEDPVLSPGTPVVFVDLEGTESLPERSTSWENAAEADCTVRTVRRLCGYGVAPEAVGVITPYLSQTRRIRRGLDREGLEAVEVKSVDGFQGREKEVIVISFVRSNVAHSVGFVADARRLNVAMTRARSKLIMVGNRATLEANTPFDALFSWLESREDAVIAEGGNDAPCR